MHVGSGLGVHMPPAALVVQHYLAFRVSGPECLSWEEWQPALAPAPQRYLPPTEGQTLPPALKAFLSLLRGLQHPVALHSPMSAFAPSDLVVSRWSLI